MGSSEDKSLKLYVYLEKRKIIVRLCMERSKVVKRDSGLEILSFYFTYF